MRLACVAGEAWRNLLSGTAHAAAWAVPATLIALGLAASDVAAIAGLQQRATELREAGAATFRLSAPKGVDGQRCDNLATVPGVTGAGAWREAGDVTDLAMPGSPLPGREVTAGIARVLAAEPLPVPGVYVTDSVASSLGVRPGGHLVTRSGPVPVAAVYAYPEDGRIRDLGYSILQPVPPTGPFDACWVSVWPLSEQILPLLRATVSSTDTELKAEVAQANSSLGRSFDGAREFDSRPTGYAWALGAVIGLVLGFAATWARRLEHAASLHAGVPKPALVAGALLEATSWAWAALLIAGAGVWLLAHRLIPADPLPAVAAGLRIVIAASSAIVPGAFLAALLTRERRLFRYFKSR